MKKVETKVSVNFDLKENWTRENKIIPYGVLVCEMDTGYIKLGCDKRYMETDYILKEVLEKTHRDKLSKTNKGDGYLCLDTSGMIADEFFMEKVVNEVLTRLGGHDKSSLSHPKILKELRDHIGRKDNPHNVVKTKSDVGLSNLVNERQIPLREKGVANGVCNLDKNTMIPNGRVYCSSDINSNDAHTPASIKSVHVVEENRKRTDSRVTSVEAKANDGINRARAANNLATKANSTAEFVKNRVVLSATQPAPYEDLIWLIPEN